MATVEEKKRELAKLLNSRGRGKELAESVFQEAAQVESKADQAGIAYKERQAASAPFVDVPAYGGNPSTGIGTILRGS